MDPGISVCFTALTRKRMFDPALHYIITACRTRGKQSVAAALMMLMFVRAVSAQPGIVRLQNPEALEFDVPVGQVLSTSEMYRVDLFEAAAFSGVAAPFRSFDAAGAPIDNGLRVRIELQGRLAGVPDGEYVATIRSVQAGSVSAATRPTDPFVVFGQGATAGLSLSTTPPTEAERRSERFWTKVAIAIGATLLIVPFVAR